MIRAVFAAKRFQPLGQRADGVGRQAARQKPTADKGRQMRQVQTLAVAEAVEKIAKMRQFQRLPQCRQAHQGKAGVVEVALCPLAAKAAVRVELSQKDGSGFRDRNAVGGTGPACDLNQAIAYAHRSTPSGRCRPKSW